MRPVSSAYSDSALARSVVRTPGIVDELKIPETGSPPTTPRLNVGPAPATPPVVSHMVVRRNVPPSVSVWAPLTTVTVSNRL